MTFLTVSRRVLPFAALLAAGCASTAAGDDATAGSESAVTARSAEITLSVDDCEDPFLIRPAALGDRIAILAPSDWHLEEALSLDADELPVTSAPSGGATKRVWSLTASEPERFLRRGRFFLVKDDGTSSAQCNFDVSAPGWSRADAGQWIPGQVGQFEQSKDLGVISAGLVLAGALHGDASFGATFSEVEGSPARVSRIGREGQWVYEAPGHYKVDVVSFATGYGRMTTHVAFEIRR